MNSHNYDSRILRFITVQEILLEYSLFIVVLACFFLVSSSAKLIKRDVIEDGGWVGRL